MRVGEKNPKNVWWNDVRAAVERKEVLGVRYEVTKDMYGNLQKKKRERLKGVHTRCKKQVNDGERWRVAAV